MPSLPKLRVLFLSCIASASLLSLTGCSTPTDPFGKPYEERYGMKRGSRMCDSKEADVEATLVRGNHLVLSLDRLAKLIEAEKRVKVDIKYRIETDGRVSILEATTDGSPEFVTYSSTVVSDWRATPAMKNGKPIPVDCTMTMVYTPD